MDFLEERRLCAPTQTGFRPQMSINHHLLALQHIIDRRIHRPARSQRKLYCCFVDLTAAYDCVQRPLMWRRCADKASTAACWQLSSPYTPTPISP